MNSMGYFGDDRLRKNGELICQRMIEYQTTSLRKLADDRANEVKFGRFFSNENVKKEEMIENILNKTKPLVKDRHILAIQDTTELNYQSHKNRVSGLGTVGNGVDIGFFLHPMLAVDAEEETCLGLCGIHSWMRTEDAKEDYQKQAIEEKESFRWLDTAEKAKAILSEAKWITIIADRESDIYEEWARIPDERTHLITRACRDRKLGNGLMLSQYVAELPVAGIYEFYVKTRKGKRTEHLAKLEIRFGEVEILKPKRRREKGLPKQIKLRVVDVREIPETIVGNEEPIHWCLLTTHEVNTVEDALRIVHWYCLRWNIEQLFRTLKKQGLDIEGSQLETGEALMKLGIMALYAAMQVMQLTMAREGKDQEIRVIFDDEACRVLTALQSQLEGKTQKQKNSHSPEKLSWAAWIIARLGGWKGYKSERPPGPITMHRGLQEFQILCRGVQLAKNVCIH